MTLPDALTSWSPEKAAESSCGIQEANMYSQEGIADNGFPMQGEDFSID